MKSGGYFSTKLSEDVSAFPAQMNADDAKLWGIATHACFEHGLAQNPWLDKHLPSDSHLEEVVRQAIRGKQGKINPAAVVASFLELCQKATVRRTLSQSFYSLQTEQTIKVEHERRFAVRLGDQGKLLRGFIDRLVMIEASGKVVSMDIIDYKTDRVGGGRSTKDLAEERGYFDQLAAYRRGMSQLFGIEEQRITARLLFVECDEVVELEHSTIPSGNTTLSL